MRIAAPPAAGYRSIKLLGALGNATFLEYMPWLSRLYNEALEFRDGRAVVPERPGWRFTFDRDYIAHLSRWFLPNDPGPIRATTSRSGSAGSRR